MSTLPAEIEVVEAQEGPYRSRRYRLPKRTMPGVGCMIWAGWIAVCLFGGLPVAAGLFALNVAKGDRWEFQLAAFLVPVCFFGIFTFPYALYVLVRVIFIHLGRLEIVVQPERLLIVQRWALVGWTRRIPLQGLRGLRVITDRPFNPDDPKFSQNLSKVGTLLADYHGGRRKTVCWGYPASWLEQFGQALTDEVSRQPGLTAHLLPVTRESEVLGEIWPRDSQPSNSTAVVHNDGDQLTIELPRPSIWGSVHPVFLIFTLIWNGLLALFTCLFILAAVAGRIQSDDPAEQSPIWVLVLFLIPFYAIGAACLVYWIGMSRRWSRIVLADDRLQLFEYKLWRTTGTDWPADQIVAVRALSRVVKSEEEVSSSHSLRIEPREGDSRQFLEWRPKSELEWLATLLRKALHLPEDELENP